MHQIWQTARHPRTTLKVTVFISVLVAATILPMLSNPLAAHADINNTRADAFGTNELTGASWLNGGGVDIYSNGSSANDHTPITNNKVNNVTSGEEWQCVEMVNRLYLTKGWTTATWNGNGNTLVNNVPSGLTKEDDGSISYLNPGDVITLDDGGSGHAGIINSVGSTIQIVNQNTVAVYSSAKVASGTSFGAKNADIDMVGWAGYTVQAIIHHPTPPPPPPPPSTYPLTLSADYDETTGLTEVFSGDQKNNMLRETSWLYGQTPQTVSISASISGNIVDIASFVVNGWRHLYTATSTGAIYETVWQAGQSPTTWQVASVPNVVGIAATYDSSNGLTEVFSVDSGRNIAETYWLYNQTPQTIGITQLPSGTTPTSIGAILYNGYRHVEVSTKEGPVTETVWQAGQSPTTWQVASIPNAVGIDAAMSGSVTEVFTLDSSNVVHETYWDYGQQPQSDIVTTLQGTASDIAAFVTANGYRHVYGSTADTPHNITETWWYPTQSATTWTVTSF